MKKILTFIICLLLILSASACRSLDSQLNDVSSELSSENDRTLIRALTGSDDISLIENLSIIHHNNSAETKINNSKDWAFLKKYVYFDTVSAEERNNLIASSKTNLIKIGVSEQEKYLLKDGSIIIQEMCGDSGVKEEDRNFEIYKAEEKYMLNEQKLIDLLEKYDNSLTNKD